MIRTVRRLAAIVCVLVGLTVLAAPAAGADGVRPGNFESVIDAVEPPTDSVEVEIVGGDSFFQVTVQPGVAVDIPGYDGEPYLRVQADGTVEQNRRSTSTYINESRDGDVGRLPSIVDGDAEPDWEQIADGGRVAWHDHRVHWMLDTPPETGADGLVQAWELPLRVDGAEVVVAGRLLRHGDVLPWAGLLAAAVAVGAALLARRQDWRAPLLLTASLVATVLAVSTQLANPPGAEASLLPIVWAVLAAVVSVVALTAGRLAPGRLPSVVTDLALPLGAVALLAGWAVPQLGVLWMPTVPGTLAPWLVRAATGVVLGLATGVAVGVLLRPSAAPPGTAVAPPEPQPSR